MVSSKKWGKGKGKVKTSGKKVVATAENTKSGAEGGNDASPSPPEQSPLAVKEETVAAEETKSGGGDDAGNTDDPGIEKEKEQESQGDAPTAAATTAVVEKTAAVVAPDSSVDAQATEKKDEEEDTSRGGEEIGIASEASSSLPEGSTGKDTEGGGEGREAAPPTGAVTKVERKEKEGEDVTPLSSGAVGEREPAKANVDLKDEGVVHKEITAPAEVVPPKAPEEGQQPDGGESSDEEEEGDGFRIVVGREAPPPSAPAAPAKRFLRGTNTLVNTNTTSGAGTEESRGAPASKPVSAAAGIASLVPSKGAPVAMARPSLKPGEYPPTAELQQSTGKTAFDVDIDGMEEQPWRHPGVDIADFFNYGFTEDSWRVYCEKQLRNRYDRSLGRSKNVKITGGRGGSSSSGHNRHGGGGGGGLTRRGGDRSGGLERPLQSHNNGPQGPKFRSQGPAGNAWGGAAPGGARFAAGFGSGPPPGVGNVSPPWFDGQPQIRPSEQQILGPGSAAGEARGAGLRQGNTIGMDGSGGVRRGLSPDPRDGSSEKMARLR